MSHRETAISLNQELHWILSKRDYNSLLSEYQTWFRVTLYFLIITIISLSLGILIVNFHF